MTSPNTRNIRINVDIDGDSRGATKAAKSLDDTAKSADRAGDSLRHMGIDAKALNAEIATSNKRIAELRSHLVEVGNDRGVRKALRGEESWLRELTKISVAVGEAGGSIGAKGIGSTAGSTGGSLAGSGPGGAAVVGGVAMGLAPFTIPLGAMIAGTVAGAIGTGGVAGGLVMAAHDPKVKAGASALGDSISAEFFRMSDVFAGPTLAAMREIDDAFKDMKVPEAFAKMAPHIGVIAEGLGDLGTNIMPGLNKAFDRMGPFADVAAEGLGDLGSALGGFMANATDSEGAVQGLNAAFKLVEGGINLTGGALEIASDIFGATSTAGERLFTTLEKLGIGGPVSQIAEGFEDINSKALRTDDALAALHETISGPTWDEYREKIEGVNTAMADNFDIAMSVDQANLAVAEGLARVNETFKENKGHWDTATEKGRANNDVLLAQIENLNGQREANIRAGQDAKVANANFDAQLNTLLRLAGAAGATKEQLDRLKGTYAINVRVNVTGLSNIDKVDFRRGFAAGGTTPAHSPFWVGEKGPELMFSDRSHFVATNSQSKALTSGGEGVTIEASFRPGMGTRLEDAILNMIRYEVRLQGGGDVQKAFGRN